jgi:ORF6N domain
MAKAKKAVVKIIPDETIIRKIYLLRGEKVLLDMDLAVLYEIDNKQLKRQVRRNIERFPEDFMFELNPKEYNSLRSQFGSLNRGAHSKYMPFAFTEQGVAMLSGVINSPKAIEMNIAIMRAFVETRKLLHSNKKIAEEIKMIFDRLGEHDVQLSAIYDALENLMDEKTEEKVKKIGWEERERIGFKK